MRRYNFAKTALTHPSLLYDFKHNTDVQGWPLGPRDIRPYIYPPSALFVFIPYALFPMKAGLALWVATTGALYLWAVRRTGAPWWMVALSPCRRTSPAPSACTTWAGSE